MERYIKSITALNDLTAMPSLIFSGPPIKANLLYGACQKETFISLRNENRNEGLANNGNG